jgi:hypothetical protein
MCLTLVPHEWRLNGEKITTSDLKYGEKKLNHEEALFWEERG